MDLDKSTLNKLRKYAQVFKDARERNANESDTVLYLVKFFEDVLGYDSLIGEISKEVAIKDRYCDFGIRLNGSIQLLIEAKAASIKALRDKDIEQAENYASRSGLQWVLLTNGVEWKLFHLTFVEGEGINHDELFSVNLLEDLELNPTKVWNAIGLLRKEMIIDGSLEDFLGHMKVLSPSSLLKTLFAEEVLTVVRRELNRSSEVRLELKDVFEAMKNVISTDALLSAGDLNLKKRRKKRKKIVRTDESGKQIVTEEEVEEDDASSNEPPTPSAAPEATSSTEPKPQQ